jgi:hypothetical protein
LAATATLAFKVVPLAAAARRTRRGAQTRTAPGAPQMQQPLSMQVAPGWWYPAHRRAPLVASGQLLPGRAGGRALALAREAAQLRNEDDAAEARDVYA